MLRKHCPFFVFICAMLFLFFSYSIEAQSYGLQFKGIEESLDNRTGLNLTSEASFTFSKNFEISFDYNTRRLEENSNVGLFGYIFRIINQEGVNVDLLSTVASFEEGIKFSVVSGALKTMVQANYPDASVFLILGNKVSSPTCMLMS